MSLMLVAALLAQGAVPTDTIGVAPPTREPIEIEPAPRVRRFGLHLGLNATLTFDAAIGRYFYGGASTSLLGFAGLANLERNYPLELLVFAGVGLPVVENRTLRLSVDLTPALGYHHSSPVNFVTVGFLAGLRLVHRTGFTFGVKLPLVGYAGAPDAQRGSVYYYYIQAIFTAPVITFGYSF